eukprot:1200295-Rhodomonas_salina.1
MRTGASESGGSRLSPPLTTPACYWHSAHDHVRSSLEPKAWALSGRTRSAKAVRSHPEERESSAQPP